MSVCAQFLVWPRLLVLPLLALSFLGSAGWGQTTASREYRNKAHFLANVSSVIEWPENAFHSPKQSISICVFGHFQFGASLAADAGGLRIHGRTLEVRWIRNESNLVGCRVLFVSRSESANYGHILSLVNELPTLTVGETDDFLDSGGMIALSAVRETLKFDVNLDAASAAHLRMSSSFLTLARRVVRGQEAARS